MHSKICFVLSLIEHISVLFLETTRFVLLLNRITQINIHFKSVKSMDPQIWGVIFKAKVPVQNLNRDRDVYRGLKISNVSSTRVSALNVVHFHHCIQFVT